MGRPRTLDDDFDLDLPDGHAEEEERDERDTSGTSDDTWDPEDDSDLGLDDLDGPEDIGLDAATGLDDDADLDLDDSGEDERWTTDSEEAEELADEEVGTATSADQEYGWLGDDEPAAEDDTFDPDLRDDEAPAMDDGGAEGLDDDSDLDGVDEASLPRLDSGADEDPVDDPTFEALDELTDAPGQDDALVDIGGVLCRRLPPRCIRRRPPGTEDGRGPATMGLQMVLDEDGAQYRYACTPHDGAWWIVRSPLAGKYEKPLAIAALTAEIGEPLALTATCVEGLVTLRVRGSLADALIEASLDGEDLA